jgi:hypothetical protein
VMLHQANNGSCSEMAVTLDYLRDKYGKAQDQAPR